MRFNGMDVGRVLVRVKVCVTAAQDHLSDVVHAVPCGLLIALRARLRQLVAHYVQAPQLVEHRYQEGFVVGAEVHNAVAGDESRPRL